MYELYEPNLFVLAQANKKTFELHRDETVHAVFKHFGTIHRAVKEQLHVLQDSDDGWVSSIQLWLPISHSFIWFWKHRFNEQVVKDVTKIRDIMNDPKMKHEVKKQKISEEYAILFNRIRAYLYTSE